MTGEQLARSQSVMDFFRQNADPVQRFQRRAQELGQSGRDMVITVINVDDPLGGILADSLMPGHDWQKYRDAGAMPVARGLAVKERVVAFLGEAGYGIAASELANTDDLRVLVVHEEMAVVMDVIFDA